MKHLILILTGFILSGLYGCSKKDLPAAPPIYDSTGRMNQWILDSMKRYYYWGDQIVAKPVSTDPDQFFKRILSVNDRFSWISNGMDILPPSNSYFIYGFHYVLMQVDGYQGLIGVVTAVNKGGAADMAGLSRGSYFIAIDGEAISDKNMGAVNLALRTPSSVKITPAIYDNNKWKPAEVVTLSPGYASENPAEGIRIFETNGVRTGYLYYASFDERYDAQLLQAVNKLKLAAVTELILDIRYNAGGSVASSAKLAALIANKLTANEIYAIYAGNHFEGRRGRTLQEVLNTSGYAAGRLYEDLKPMQLSLSRIFILTTGGTVSAAELIVNNLRPFLQVIQIGETTRGKNEAGFLISDHRNPPQVAWTLEPTVYKLFNKSNEGNYEQGLIPQYPVSELAALPLTAMGGSGDPLVKKALQIIYGNNIPDDYTVLKTKQLPLKATPVYRSVDEISMRPMLVK
jgi:carboxyl-terminal processing protease